jgi:phosphoribosylformimino-5-aminoimidazole carboxamide ribotide isomerase
VADLDALQGQPPQQAAVQALRSALPGIELWLDAGFGAPEDAAPSDAGVVPVLASETLRTLHGIDARRHVLSLDQRDGRPLDRAGCWQTARAWPERVIVMTLESVGAGTGPDLDTLAAVRARAAPGTQLIGAGGLRDAVDLQTAGAAGAWGWLVASALHDGRIGASMAATAS